jgi:polysaccharide deacetylase family protein (PEP-CTERM system associated)
MIAHHFTVDVEEYFQVSALEPSVARSQWDSLESRVSGSVRELLRLLDEHEARATFFVLGWIAERHPQLVRGLSQGGHEVASHGWDHRLVTRQNPEQFRHSVRRSKAVLEEITRTEVVGFRAPSFSIVPGREWALDILLEEGYRYDSSLFPIRRPGHGYSNGDRDPYWIRRPAGTLAEIPPTTVRWFGLNIPAAGGAYFRHLPYGLVQAGLRDAEERGAPGTFYIHPWELDPDQPRVAAPWMTRWRHYGGLDRTRERLRRLLDEFRFRTIARTMAAMTAEQPAAESL